MKSVINLSLTGLLVLVLSGCILLKTNLHPDDKLDPKLKTGVIMGSVSQDPSVGIFHTNSSFFIYSEDKKEYAKVSARELEVLFIHADSLFEGYEGQIFAVEFPEGAHQLKEWSVVVGNVIYSPRYPLRPISINVKPGEVTYIGNLHMKLGKGENLLGMDRAIPRFPIISDQYDRDLPLFSENFPNLVSLKVNKQVSFQGPWVILKKQKAKKVSDEEPTKL